MEIGLLVLLCLTFGLLFFLLFRKKGNSPISLELQGLIKKEFYQNREELTKNLRETRLEITQSMERLNEFLAKKAKDDREELRATLKDFQEAFSKNVTTFNELQKQNFERLNQKQDELVKSTELKLEKMRETVDEKLHKTLEERLGKSFEMVTQQLLKVQKGLGEMQTLASGVGDLKKVLSNVKTSGVLGEIQLGNILEQILAPEQYDTNVKTKKDSDAHVEFAIKLPGKNNSSGPVYLPVDAKFPQEDYARLQSAYEAGDPLSIEASLGGLLNTVKKFAKDISQRYIDPPHTTDFGIMFLPFEGLYAEVTRHPKVIAQLQREFKIILTGPTTLAAMLNSLQMGFKTLAIQKRSSEVWEVLASVKKEFSSFGKVLEKAQNKIKEADKEIEKMVTTRTRMMLSKLSKVEQIELPKEDEEKEEGDLFKLQ
ncbi:MAG: DNA recombination protein RmuC [Bacteroidota bacterium]|nr:DNA recombination protein RmuC [Bacteroidota bacterium]